MAAAAAGEILGATPAPPARGFQGAAWEKQRALEEKLRTIADPLRIEHYMKRMAAEPHHAGSHAGKAVAEYALALFRKFGFTAHIETFDVFLPYPKERLVELSGPTSYRLRLSEPNFAQDPDSKDKNQLPTYNAYSAAGDVTGELVYVNYGVPDDYKVLRERGIDVRGKVVLARYGMSWRGVKPKVAAENGAIACLIYSDPKEDGFTRGCVSRWTVPLRSGSSTGQRDGHVHLCWRSADARVGFGERRKAVGDFRSQDDDADPSAANLVRRCEAAT